MRTIIKTSILAMAVTLAPALAQAQTPQTDSAAIGGDVGIFFPKSDPDENIADDMNTLGHSNFSLRPSAFQHRPL